MPLVDDIDNKVLIKYSQSIQKILTQYSKKYSQITQKVLTKYSAHQNKVLSHVQNVVPLSIMCFSCMLMSAVRVSTETMNLLGSIFVNFFDDELIDVDNF